MDKTIHLTVGEDMVIPDGIENVILSGSIRYDQLEIIDDLFRIGRFRKIIFENISFVDFSKKVVGVDNYHVFALHYAENLSMSMRILMNLDWCKEYVIHDTYISSLDGKTLFYLYFNEDVFIPDGIDTIGNGAFVYEQIRNVYFSASIKYIGDLSFAFSTIKNALILPESIVSLGRNVFNSAHLADVYLPGSLKKIPFRCFSNACLKSVNMKDYSIEEVENHAFDNCVFEKKIRLPEGLKFIGSSVFSNLKSLVLPSTIERVNPDFHTSVRYESKLLDAELLNFPCLKIDVNNKVYYTKKGTLYWRGSGKLATIHPHVVKDRKYSIEEVLSCFPANYCKPINSQGTLFRCWYKPVSQKWNCYNLLSSHLKSVWKPKSGRSLFFLKDNYVLTGNVILSMNLKYQGRISRKYVIDDVDEQGRILVRNKDEKYKFGFIDIKENILVPFEYNSLTTFDDKGYAIAQKGKKYGCIDDKNNVIIPFDYLSFYRYFIDDIAIVLRKDTKDYAYLTRDNRLDGVLLDNRIWEKGFHIYTRDGKFGYSKQFGNQRTDPIYMNIQKIDEFHLIVDDGECETIVSYDNIQ